MSPIGEYAVLGALSAVHQFVRIGAYAFIGEMAGIPIRCLSIRNGDRDWPRG